MYGENKMGMVSASDLSRCGILPGMHVLVAFSGGADSTALLLQLIACRNEGRIKKISAAHFNHCLRGEASDEDEDFCRDLCEKEGIPFVSGSGDVAAYAAERSVSTETAARELRYAFLREQKELLHADCIALAHHANDQAETVLMHLMRGSGLRGLCGMEYRSGDLVRPLLDRTHEELVSYLAENGRQYRTDDSNSDSSYTRNRVREELIPCMESFRPDVVQTIRETAERLRMDEEYLDGLAGKLEECAFQDGGYRRDILMQAEEPVRIRVLLRILRKALQYDFTAADVNGVDGLLFNTSGKRIDLAGGISAVNDGDLLRVGVRTENEFHPVILVPDSTVRFGDWVITVKTVTEFRKPESCMEACLSLDRFSGRNMVLRSRRNGDRMEPLGLDGSKLVSDIQTDRKLPEKVRRAPLLTMDDEILFVPGYTIAEKAKVIPGSRYLVNIIYEENKGEYV